MKLAQLKKLADSSGATLEVEDRFRGYTVKAQSPLGRVFAVSFTHEVVMYCVGQDAKSRAIAHAAIAQDVAAGFVPCSDGEGCEWCFPALNDPEGV